ncbi:MAG: flagellar hook-basal body complex protein FliE [Planctomycetes bacterium]|nr:flagellar hook-basal body complex protein FliE [Planctomycetota bacterium]MDA0947636.1 flagellar hook-basal body complex protein FliE [Planctomycetota bacterium]
MVNGIGSGASGRDSLSSALQRMQQKIAQLQDQQTGAASATAAETASAFESSMSKAVSGLDTQMRATEDLPVQALKGDLDLHEVTTQIKQTELAFEFSMQVRNKFIDAYREVMRMSV